MHEIDIPAMMEETWVEIMERAPHEAITGLFMLTATAIGAFSWEYGWSQKDIDQLMGLGRQTMFDKIDEIRQQLESHPEWLEAEAKEQN